MSKMPENCKLSRPSCIFTIHLLLMAVTQDPVNKNVQKTAISCKELHFRPSSAKDGCIASIDKTARGTALICARYRMMSVRQKRLPSALCDLETHYPNCKFVYALCDFATSRLASRSLLRQNVGERRDRTALFSYYYAWDKNN